MELIPLEEQIRAASMQDARTFSSTTTKGEEFCAAAEEVHATRTKEEEMVQELFNRGGTDKIIKNNLLILLFFQ